MLKPLPTVRQLRYLVALDDHRHFGRAAESCLATQSTLSAGLQELESLLGVLLVERTRRKVMLTPLGQEVARRARLILRDVQELGEVARSAAGDLSGPLRLGVIPTIGPWLLPDIMPALRQSWPDLKLYLREDLTARLLERLFAGDLDLVLIALPWDASNLEVAALAQDPFLFAAPATHPLLRSSMIDMADLARQSVLLLEEGHCLRDHAMAACRLPPTNQAEAVLGTSLVTVVHMVANGLGVTLLPKLAVDHGILAGTDLQTRPIEGAPSRGLGLAWRSSSPRRREFTLLADYLRNALTTPANALIS